MFLDIGIQKERVCIGLKSLAAQTFHPTKSGSNHSLRSDFTGFANAARTLWKPTLSSAFLTAAKAAAANIHH